jgi:post-segregation antitoxin (ccd killing protein)
MHSMKHKDEKPTNVRLAAGSKSRLMRVARAHGINASDLVRTAIAEKLPIWESSGVSLAKLS